MSDRSFAADIAAALEETMTSGSSKWDEVGMIRPRSMILSFVLTSVEGEHCTIAVVPGKPDAIRV